MLSTSLITRTCGPARLALTVAFAAWVGVASVLPIDALGDDSRATCASSLLTQARTIASIVQSQSWRGVGCRSSVREGEESDSDDDSSEEEATPATIAKRDGNKRATQFQNQSLSIVSPDHLIELPGTPPPAAIC